MLTFFLVFNVKLYLFFLGVTILRILQGSFYKNYVGRLRDFFKWLKIYTVNQTLTSNGIAVRFFTKWCAKYFLNYIFERVKLRTYSKKAIDFRLSKTSMIGYPSTCVRSVSSFRSVCQFVSLSVCQFVSLPIFHFVSLSVCQFVSMSDCQFFSMSVCQYVSLPVCQLVNLPVCQPVSLLVCQSV
jgi:hypothetical protein